MTAYRLDQLTAANLPLRLGRYELKSILGTGGMARVFGAELLGPAGFRKQVAVKVIKPEALERTNSDDVESFIREARLGGLLKHPNIVDVYEFGDVGGQLFIVMELVAGQTLSKLIRSGDKPPASVVLEVATGITAGLASAHSLSADGLPAGLVHRDMKPSNVLVSWDGAVKIADFGIAITHLGDLASSLEDQDSILGTLSYMSPEQLLGEPLDERTDLFSLGLILIELATATRLPRRHLFKHLVAHGALHDPVIGEDYLSRVDEAVPGLGRILRRCLALDPDDRYTSARELLAEFEGLRQRVGLFPQLRIWLPPSSRPLRPDTVVDATTPLELERTDETATNAESKTVLAKGPLARTNLGAPLDSFVGRVTELERLTRLFEGGERLVTIKGTGGAGKTRFSRRFARSQVDKLAGGAWFVDLTEARTPEGLTHATAMALALPLGSGDIDALATQVGHAILGRGPLLLVLDNFEQVVEHAATTVGRWHQMAPEARFLVTSREPLKLEGEQVFALRPLPEADGVALFESRAQAAGARLPKDPKTHSAIARIVLALDGLPLAIELAAARARVLTPVQLLERLSDRFKLLGSGRRSDSERQQTLSGLIDWSWDLLASWEQSALAQLSVFHDGFFMGSAEAVLDLSAWPDAPWSLDVVGSLLDKSLLHSWEVHDQPRFGMYLSIQEYAAQKLGAETATTALRHAQHFASLGEEGFLESLYTHGGAERQRVLANELENLLASVNAALAHGAPETAANCALAAGTIFHVHGPFSDGIALLERVLEQPASSQALGRLTLEVGWLLFRRGRVSASEQRIRQALAIHRQAGNRRGEGIAVGRLANIYREQGRIPESLEHYHQALAIHREVGNRPFEGRVLGGIAWHHRQQGHYVEALNHYQQSLAIHREVGNRQSEGINFRNLALCYHDQGRYSEALEHYHQAIHVAREI
ncbi:MAG TPA: hypothetical protein DIU15_05945, partial [Deltaproteobacteria bacterium]|nr:hypothetical protein [Deltaproteobacteria bacterium]